MEVYSRFLNGFVKKFGIEEQLGNKVEIFKYGFTLLLSNIIGCFTIVLISGIFFRIYYSIAFLGVFFILRGLTGGYHAKTYLKCFLISNFLFMIVVIISKFDFPNYVYIIEMIGSSLYILTKTPVIHKNKEYMRKVNRTKNKIITGIMLLFYFSIYMCGSKFIGDFTILHIIANTIFVDALLMVKEV